MPRRPWEIVVDELLLRVNAIIERDGNLENVKLTIEEKVAVLERRKQYVQKRRFAANAKDRLWSFFEGEALGLALTAMEMVSDDYDRPAAFDEVGNGQR